MPLDPHRLHLLIRLSEVGTVRAVADALLLSPSTVSQQLAVLEREARTVLLVRVGRRVVLTPEAEALVARARPVLAELDALERSLHEDDRRAGGTVRIGAFSSAMQPVVFPAVHRLAATHPGLTCVVTEMEPGRSLSAVARAEVDIAVTSHTAAWAGHHADGLTGRELGKDEVVVVTPRGTPTTPGRVPLQSFAGHAWASDLPATYLDDLLLAQSRAAGFTPRVTGRFSGFDVLLRYVESGAAVALLPELAVDAHRDVGVQRLQDPARRTIRSVLRRSDGRRASLRVTHQALVEAAAGP